jgi:adenylate cyclase
LARGIVPVPEAIELMLALADALAEVHALGIVHRDLKPSNVILTSRGPKILDFGVASLKGTTRLTSTGLAIGTPLTMSPEQLQGRPTDNRADLWALGVTLYRALTGRPPFTGDNFEALSYQILSHMPPPPSALNSSIGPDLDYIVMKLLRKDPDARYARAEDLMADLSNCDACAIDAALHPAKSQTPSVAVLYFDVLSADPQDAFLAAGLTEDLIVDLTRLEGIRVAGRAEVLQYRDRNVPPRTLGRELGVDYVVNGSVRRVGTRARIVYQMVRAGDSHVMCGDRLDRSVDDLFEMQAEVSKRIVNALQVALDPDQREMLDRVPTKSRDAYADYLRGRAYLDTGTREGNFLAEEEFKSAIARDDQFALAHAALGETYARRGMTWWAGPEIANQAMPAADRALALEPTLLEGHLVRAMVHRLRGEPEPLLRAIERVIAMNPNHSEALEWAGWSYLAMNKPEQALPILERVSKIAPERYLAVSFLASCYEMLGRHEDYVRTLQAARDSSIEVLRKHPANVHARSILGTLLIGLGEPTAGIDQCERAVAIAPADTRVRYNLACTYARAGRVDDSIAQLREATSHLPEFVADWPLHDPDLVNVRHHPEFVKLFGRAQGLARSQSV